MSKSKVCDKKTAIHELEMGNLIAVIIQLPVNDFSSALDWLTMGMRLPEWKCDLNSLNEDQEKTFQTTKMCSIFLNCTSMFLILHKYWEGYNRSILKILSMFWAASYHKCSVQAVTRNWCRNPKIICSNSKKVLRKSSKGPKTNSRENDSKLSIVIQSNLLSYKTKL